MGRNDKAKMIKLIRRSFSNGLLFSSISKNFTQPIQTWTGLSTKYLVKQIQGKWTKTLMVGSKSEMSSMTKLKHSYDHLNKKASRTSSIGNNQFSKRNSFIKTPLTDLKIKDFKKDMHREDIRVWGQPELQENFLYSLTDYFDTKGFNMSYVKKVSAKEINLRKKQLTLLKNKPEFISKEDTKRIKNMRRDLRMKIKELERQRSEILNRNQQYSLIGYTSKLEGFESPLFGSFSASEIFIAKLCKANGLERPPNYYDFSDLRNNDSMENHQMTSNSSKNNSKSFISKGLTESSEQLQHE